MGNSMKVMTTMGKMTHGDDKHGIVGPKSGKMANNACK